MTGWVRHITCEGCWFRVPMAFRCRQVLGVMNGWPILAAKGLGGSLKA